MASGQLESVTRVRPSSESQGQLVEAGKSQNGREKIRAEKSQERDNSEDGVRQNTDKFVAKQKCNKL